MSFYADSSSNRKDFFPLKSLASAPKWDAGKKSLRIYEQLFELKKKCHNAKRHIWIYTTNSTKHN